MRWGNIEAAHTLLQKISRREGIGDLLAEGVKRASEKLGGEAANMGVYILKGSTPRGHDHRAIWPNCWTLVSPHRDNSVWALAF